MKLSKSIIAGVIALILVISCGIIEVVVLSKRYETLRDECLNVMQKVTDESLTAKQYTEFKEHWITLRETSELLLPHVDVYELNLRIAEAEGCIATEEWNTAYTHLSVVSELLSYIPHLMVPNIKHII